MDQSASTNVENAVVRNSTTVNECCSSDFQKWKDESVTKHIINNIIVDYNAKVTLPMISDSIAWNICNLRKPVNWQIPEQSITGTAKVKSVLWIKYFKSYVMAYMKRKWEAKYVQLFHLPKFNGLRTNKSIGILSFTMICKMMKSIRSFEVSSYKIAIFVSNFDQKCTYFKHYYHVTFNYELIYKRLGILNSMRKYSITGLAL